MSANAGKFDMSQTMTLIRNASLADNKNSIKPKALHDFTKTFKNVSNEDWYLIKNGYMAKFENQDILYRVLYNKKGKWAATYSYYNEGQLSAGLRNLIKSTWYNATITQVTEVKYGGKAAYLINIEDNTSIKTIKVVNDEMEVYQEIIK
jgi:Zn/Cd-binding protein ZinT